MELCLTPARGGSRGSLFFPFTIIVLLERSWLRNSGADGPLGEARRAALRSDSFQVGEYVEGRGKKLCAQSLDLKLRQRIGQG